MTTSHVDDPLAIALAAAIHGGDVAALAQLLRDNPEATTMRIADDKGSQRTLLHVLTDWPGHFPNGPEVVAALVRAGADVNARFRGAHAETPLHWAASSDDVPVLDALLDAGADIDADGGVIGGGTPLADARAFTQRRAAHRLVDRGARTTLTDAATLGLLDRVTTWFPGATQEEVNVAFWGACHGGQQACAEYLLGQGAELDWVPPWEPLTPLDAAVRRDAVELVRWLRSRGARSAVDH